jgi:uroporphyrinogen decarboxylase
MNERFDFIEACWGRPVSRTPVWIMRQAGRYLPQYREVRAGKSFLELCKNPELATRVSLNPVEILGVDAAILFSDILVPVTGMGVGLDFKPGPVLERAVATAADVAALRVPCVEDELPFVFESIHLLRKELGSRAPLIGFCGAPFTLACYMIEGQGSRDFARVKQMMYRAPDLFAALLAKITETRRRPGGADF